MTQNIHSTPKLIPTLRDDISRGGFIATMKREAREIEEFYLSDAERELIKKKGKFWRGFVIAAWVLRNSFFKLNSLRRLLLVIGLVLLFVDVSIRDVETNLTIHYGGLGVGCILLVLILELKDKLLAHDELQSGRAVQRAMMPEATPFVPGWNVWLFTRSANEVGGDLVDFLNLGGNRYGIAIGDVAGKGLGAALFMVKIQSTLRALAPDYTSLSGLGSKLNSILLRDGMPSKFASMFFVSLEAPSGTLEYFNAGHMPPLLVTPDGVTQMAKGNPALGLSPDTRIAAESLVLTSGQSLVVYSDGLTEAQNESGEFFGVERLKALCDQCRSISAQSFGERIIAAVTAFEGDARRTDDLSLVILQKST
jgi:hypothetical protein